MSKEEDQTCQILTCWTRETAQNKLPGKLGPSHWTRAASKKIFGFVNNTSVSLDINKAKTMSHKEERFTQFTCGAKRLFYKSSKCFFLFKLVLSQSRWCWAWMETNLPRLAPNHTTRWRPVTWFVTWFTIRTPPVPWKCCKQKWRALL